MGNPLPQDKIDELSKIRRRAAVANVELQAELAEQEALRKRYNVLSPKGTDRIKLVKTLVDKKEKIAGLKAVIKDCMERTRAIARPIREDDWARANSLHQHNGFGLRNPVSRSAVSGKAISLKSTGDFSDESFS